MGESRDIVSEVLRLDREGDHVGIFLYLKGRSYDPKEALYAVYRLMAGGRFQSAYIVAKLLASSALDNPTVDLARAVGGALFCNKEDEASGSARLAQSVGRLDAGGRQAFRDSVMGPVFRHALAEEVAGSGKELRSRLLRIREVGMAEGDAPAPVPPSNEKAPARRRPAKAAGTPAAVALVFLARGADRDWQSTFSRFVESYTRFPAGADHRLYVIFKGFRNERALEEGAGLFSGLDYTPLHFPDDEFDIGAYIRAAAQIVEANACFLNTHSEIVAAGWLGRLLDNLNKPDVGLVGATGSFESLSRYSAVFLPFPNLHIRPNAFMMRTDLFRALTEGVKIRNKGDAYQFESGFAGLSSRVLARGLRMLVVGRDGQGYPPESWPRSGTFRQAGQENLLVADNHTRFYDRLASDEKQAMAVATWGKYLRVPLARAADAAPAARPEGGELAAEILRLDGQDDPVAVFTYLSGTPYDPTDALFALYKLLLAGRFQSAFLVAKVMAGAQHSNPTIDLARAIGGALFGNKEDEAHGTEQLVWWLNHMPDGQREIFRSDVAAHVLQGAMEGGAAGKDKSHVEKILAIRARVIPEPEASRFSGAAPAKPAAKRASKARRASS